MAADVYTAATVMIAIRLYPSVVDDLDENLLKESWACALQVLRTYQEYSRSAKRCLKTLEVLDEKIVGGSSAHEVNTAPIRIPRVDRGLDVDPTLNSRAGDALDSQDLRDLSAIFDVRDMAWLDLTPFDLEIFS